ncbi:hypothetical protein ACLB1E_14410 [Escherichia coli]
MHGFAFAGVARSDRAPPELARIPRVHATALKPPVKRAGVAGKALRASGGA